MIRYLKATDAPLMLEWMHDKNVVNDMKENFSVKTIYDCYSFINNSISKTNIHMAIVNDKDEYMGTVSLKNISSKHAEFAIVIRKCAMGKHFSITGMKEILKFGFDKLELKYIYWCVNQKNQRAIRFYDKNGFNKIDINSLPLSNLVEIKCYTNDQINNYIWYIVYNNDI